MGSKTYNRRKESGLCPLCGDPPESGVNCDSCKLKIKSKTLPRNRDRVKSGLCYSCGTRQFLEGQIGKASARCLPCYLKQVARGTVGSPKHWKELSRLWDAQDGQCVYTGMQLELGNNAQLDHVKPVSKYPHLKSDPSNWQWVHEDVNLMKRNLDEAAFLRLIDRIYLHRNP